MRMAGPDIVLFVVGLALFGGASYAIYTLDDDVGGSASALGVFQVTFSPTLQEIESIDVQSLRSVTQEFDVNVTHPLNVVVLVECGGGPAQIGGVPFQMQVSVEGPTGQTAEGSGQCGQDILIEIPVGTMPESAAVAGSTEDEARANLAPSEEAADVNGTWTVTIAGSRGQQTPVAVPVVDPPGTITLSVEIAEPQFSGVQR